MASFNWERFCTTRNIEYVTSGPSSTVGNINIHCPYCGDADPSYHMGLHLKRSFWHCWRNDKHAGRKPHRLIMRLLGCSYAEAATYIDEGVVELSDFEEVASTFTLDNKEGSRSRHLNMPRDFRPLVTAKGRARMYWKYLQSRGFRTRDIPYLTRRYDLHYCDKGEWRGRIIMPIRIENKLVSWTGRTVYGTEELRYRSLSHKKEISGSSSSLVSIRDTLFNYDNVMKKHHHVCAIVEGPLDVLKIDYFGQHHGVCAIGTFGTGIRKAQLDMLDLIRKRCDLLVICGDQNAEANVMDLLSAAYDLNLQNLPLPNNVRDPGELTKHEIIDLFSKL